MKSIIKHTAIACATLLSMNVSNAQVLIQPDGGVKIGSAPKTTIVGSPSWQLPSQGLEVSIGNILFHTSKGKFGVSDFTDVVTTTSPGGIVTNRTVNATALTGSNLSVGTSSQYAFRVYTSEVISTSSQKVLSDRRYKENITDLEDASAKVLQLRPVMFDVKTPENYAGDTMALKGKVGFIAQEVQELFPGLVGYLPEVDQYVLDYTSFIPYLTQAIQLQAQQIEEQEERIADLEEMVQLLLDNQPEVQKQAPRSPSLGNEGSEERMPQAKLYQNVPNPFSGNTEIRYELPDNVRSARIEFHAATGQVVKNEVLPATPGVGSVSFESGDFVSGIHTYSLIVDNQRVATKRMVVSE